MKFALKTAALIAVLSLPLLFQSTFTEILKLRTFDYLVAKHEQSNYFAVLNITEEDIAREGGWPLPRARLAEIQNELMQKGAIGVGWAVAFPQPDRLGGDEKFAAVDESTRWLGARIWHTGFESSGKCRHLPYQDKSKWY